jgi:hypothetical protein
MQMKLKGIISVDFDASNQLLTLGSAFFKCLTKNWNKRNQCISCLQASRKSIIKLVGWSCINI